jgi:oxidase EvaA
VIEAWLSQRRAQAGMNVSPLAWRDSEEWRFESGVLRHRSGGFFSIEGVRLSAKLSAHYPKFMPMINQPEVGILGFLVHRTETGPRWLLQAKAEPGSENFVQIGPSVQATRSNYLKLHGGQPTAYLGHVDGVPSRYASWSRQSEQGTRFIGKYNANIVSFVDEELPVHNADWFWVDAAVLRDALALDYTINTDARSVLVSTDWRLLCTDGLPFSATRIASSTKLSDSYWGGSAGRAELAASYKVQTRDHDEIVAWLAQFNPADTAPMQRVSLLEMPGWQRGEKSIFPENGVADFEIQNVEVRAQRRERTHWQQPLVRNRREERYVLYISRIGADVCVYLALSDEPGFGGRAQLGPSWQSDRVNPDWTNACIQDGAGETVLSVMQSDEGGRFLSSRARYELIELEPHLCSEKDQSGVWLSLGDVQHLASTAGIITNEARSTISLILTML